MATLVRWDPVRELAAWQNDIERLMGTFLRGASTGANGERWAPPLDVWETDDELIYAFDLPGVPEDKISIELEDGTVTVSAERERPDPGGDREFFTRFERRYGSFARSIGLPQGVAESDIRADYKDGVLELHVTKPKAPEPRKIQIGKGSKATIEGSAKK